MPKINRLRIVNFVYNDNHRTIVDELFNFYGGENGLFSLQNGGGKTTMIQAMIQPIIPNAVIQKRKFEAYFRGRSTPSYILIEWALEDQGGYLLTGIGMAGKRVRKEDSDDSDETAGGLEYFTFTSPYHSANPFDIESIAFMDIADGKRTLKGLSQAREMVQEKSREAGSRLKYYVSSKGAEYGEALASYSIFQDEWKSVIKRINDAEGGLKGLFAGCEKASSLMNEWFLKTVEKVITHEDEEESEGRQSRLEKLMEDLVDEAIANEEYLRERESIMAFLDDSGKYAEQLDGLVSLLDKKVEQERDTAGLHRFLTERMDAIGKGILMQKFKIESSKGELDFIDIEERSKEYYDAADDAAARKAELDARTEDLREAEDALSKAELDVLIQHAARDSEAIQAITARLAEIMEQIEKIKGDGESAAKIQSLEYSLKLHYGKLLNQLRAEEAAIREVEGAAALRLDGLKKEGAGLDEQSNDAQKALGSAEAKVEQFESYEAKTREALGLDYCRTLFGEIDAGYSRNYLEAVRGRAKEAADGIEKAQGALAKAKGRMLEMQESEQQLHSRKQELAADSGAAETKLAHFGELEEELGQVFAKYDLDFANRFSHEENRLFLHNYIRNQEHIISNMEMEIRLTKETIEAVQEKSLHASREFRKFLNENDFEYETGESYLGRLETEVQREAILAKVPFIPYAFLFRDPEFEKLKGTEIHASVRQMVPAMTYGDLNKDCPASGSMVDMGSGIRFLCLPDRRMLQKAGHETYLAELNDKLEDTKSRLSSFKEDADTSRRDLAVVEAFSFPKDHRYVIEKEVAGIQKAISAADASLAALFQEKKDLEQQSEDNAALISALQKSVGEESAREQEFLKFLEEDKKYLENRARKAELEVAIRSIGEKKERLGKDLKEAQNTKEDLYKERVSIQQNLSLAEAEAAKYAEASEAEIIDEAPYVLEAKLKALKQDISATLDSLESDRNTKQKELRGKNRDLEGYGIEPVLYVGERYDEDKLDRFRKQKKSCEKAVNDSRKLKDDASSAYGNKSGMLAAAEKELRKVSAEPLERELIRMNFAERRADEKEAISQAEAEIDKLTRTENEFSRYAGMLRQVVDMNAYENVSPCEEPENIRKAVTECVNNLKETYSSIRNTGERVQDQFHGLQQKYQEKNRKLKNILDGLASMLDAAREANSRYRFAQERMKANTEVLNSYLAACNQNLELHDKSKVDVTIHCYLYARQVFDETMKIPQNSVVQLDGRSTPTKMLRIEMAPLSESAEDNKAKMALHIEKCLAAVKVDIQAGRDQGQTRERIRKYMSTRELLNVLSDLGSLKIKGYKIDNSIANSKYKDWESLVSENSGAERFVSYFSILIAVLSYTRTSMKEGDDFQRNKDTKVLIMDNPFGEISTAYLLKPFFDLARKYNTQLICLTDLKNKSIMNSFDLIYAMRIRENADKIRSYLVTDRSYAKTEHMVMDEKLDKAYMKAYEQERIQFL